MSDMITNEEFGEMLEHFRWKTGFPWERWIINHRRRREGKAPFRG